MFLQVSAVYSSLDSKTKASASRTEDNLRANETQLDHSTLTSNDLKLSKSNHIIWKSQDSYIMFTSPDVTEIVDEKFVIESSLKTCHACGDEGGDCGQCAIDFEAGSSYCNYHGDRTQIVYYNEFGSCHDCGRRVHPSTCACYIGYLGTYCETPYPTPFPSVSPSSKPTTNPSYSPIAHPSVHIISHSSDADEPKQLNVVVIGVIIVGCLAGICLCGIFCLCCCRTPVNNTIVNVRLGQI